MAEPQGKETDIEIQLASTSEDGTITCKHVMFVDKNVFKSISETFYGMDELGIGSESNEKVVPFPDSEGRITVEDFKRVITDMLYFKKKLRLDCKNKDIYVYSGVGTDVEGTGIDKFPFTQLEQKPVLPSYYYFKIKPEDVKYLDNHYIKEDKKFNYPRYLTDIYIISSLDNLTYASFLEKYMSENKISPIVNENNPAPEFAETFGINWPKFCDFFGLSVPTPEELEQGSKDYPDLNWKLDFPTDDFMAEKDDAFHVEAHIKKLASFYAKAYDLREEET
jgi:hypothetical protein